MSLVRIVTRHPADVTAMADRLRAQGHTVEVIDPGDFHVNGPAEVELRVTRMPRREALALALREEGEIVAAPGVVTAEEVRLAVVAAPKRGIVGMLGKWLAERRETKRARAAANAAQRREREQRAAEDHTRRRAQEQVVAEQRRREMEMEAERRRALALEAERRRQAEEEQRRQAALESELRRRDEDARQRALALEAAQRRQSQEEELFRRRQAALQEQRRREEEARLEAERQRAARQEAELRRRREEEEQHRLAALESERRWQQSEIEERERQRELVVAAQQAEEARRAAAQQRAGEAPAHPVAEPAPAAEHALFSQKAAAARAATRAHMESLRRQIPNRVPPFPMGKRQRKWMAAAVLAIAISVAMALGWGAAANQQPASPIPLSTLQSDQYTTQQLPFRNATVTMPGAAPHAAAEAPAKSETSAPAQPAAPSPQRRQLRSPRETEGGDVVIRHHTVPRPQRTVPANGNDGVKRYSDLDGD